MLIRSDSITRGKNLQNKSTDLVQIESTLKQQLDENPMNNLAAVQLGNLYYDNNDAAQAIVYYRVALDIDKNQPGVRTDMGTMYWQINSVSLAEQCYRQVIAENPGFGNAYLNLGYLLLHGKQQAQEARSIWNSLIKDWPNDPAATKIRELLIETMN